MPMFTIDEINVDTKAADLHFACDLAECKGACCTLQGGRGAPITDNEVDEIYNAYPVVKKYLSKEHKEWIERHGLVEGSPGYYATQCKNNQACVFVFYDDGVAKCSFEKAFHNKEIQWRKPLSCHLFPLRASYGVPEQLRFEYLHECEPAFKKGSREKIPLFKFLRDVLVRAYGRPWYEQFEAECEERSSNSERGD
ncbi:MAG: DUF3109 family protein [Bacteroidota bacterium]